jgi:rod shape determining protein RodA
VIKVWIVEFFSKFDKWLLIFTLSIFLLALVVLYSASNQDLHRVKVKIIFMGVALVGMGIMANIPMHIWIRLALPSYLLSLMLLLAVAFFGDVSHGARRWLNIGVTRIQPSELMKIALPLALAWFFYRFEGRIQWRHFVMAALMILLPVGLILKQPDLGTALMVTASGFYILFFAGLSWWVVGTLVVGGSVLTYVMMHWDLCVQVLHEYQCQRIATMLDPMEDPLGAGYHIIQGTIAIGSGGLFGKGWLGGTQTHLDFIPERTTDFIFAVFGEEFGLLGNLGLLILYAFVIFRGMNIANHASTLFGRLFAAAITLTFFTYAFVNMGMVSGILPVVGVPLPLISYGGTSMVSILVGFGIMMSVGRDRKFMKS